MTHTTCWNMGDRMGKVGILLNGSSRKTGSLMLSATADLIVDAAGEENVIIFENMKKSFLLRNMRNSPEFISMMFNDMTTWSEKYLLMKHILEARKVGTMVFLCSDMNIWRRDKPKPFIDFYEEFESLGTAGMSYLTMRKAYTCGVMAIAAMNTCQNIIHVFTDPTELRYDEAIDVMSPSYQVVHSVNVSGICDYVQTYEPELSVELPRRFGGLEKEYNFTFACSAVNNNRKYIKDNAPKLLSIPHSKVSFIGNVTDINGREKHFSGTKQDTYMRWNAKSRFTLVIPSYSDRTFSLERFMEGLFLDCLPLILAEPEHTCNMQAFRDTFPQMADIAEDSLMVTFDEVRGTVGGRQSMPEEWRIDILNELKATDDYKRATSFEDAESNWRALLQINTDF